MQRSRGTTSLDLSDVYELIDPLASNALRVDDDLSDEESMALERGIPPARVVRCSRFQGRTPEDLVWGGVVVCLASERLLELLTAHRVTGWTTYPVELVGAKKARIPGYRGLAVTGRCGPIQRERSRVVELRAPSGGLAKERIGLHFDPASWDGSDVFFPHGTVHPFITARVVALLERERVTNVGWERILDVRQLVYDED